MIWSSILLALQSDMVSISLCTVAGERHKTQVIPLAFPSPDGSKPPRFLLPFDYHWRHWLAAFCRILLFPWQSHSLLTTFSARQIAANCGRIRLFRRLIAFDKDTFCVPRQAKMANKHFRVKRGKLWQIAVTWTSPLLLFYTFWTE